jgi:primosomal replication protein N
MDEVFVNNRAELCGFVAEPPRYSHESRGIRFYTFPLETRRLSGTADRLNIVLRDTMLSQDLLETGCSLRVEGELRSYNNRSGVGNRLILTILARQLTAGDGQDENRLLLTGAICKSPTLRVTPMGREICDIILAVPRRYHRSDYIPVIAWGLQAQDVAAMPVGTQLAVRGRLQSRVYTKLVDNEPQQRLAFEVSAADIFPV